MASTNEFGGFEGHSEEIEQFSMRDISRHIKYLKSHFLSPDGSWNYQLQVTLPMERGDWITLKNGKRRGSNEYENEQDFREAARQLKVGIKFARPTFYRGAVGTKMEGLEMADLRWKMEPQREFSDEAVNLRVLAQAVDLATKWRDATVESHPNINLDTKRKEAKVRLDNAVAEARRINSQKTREALQKHGIPVNAPKAKAGE